MSLIIWVVGFALALPAVTTAGTPTVQADLEVSVSVTPSSFSPGSQGIVSLTLTNHGPDTAGTGSFANLVLQRGFRLEVITDRPPYEIREPVSGCVIAPEIVGPFSDLSFGFVWTYYFDAIPAGTSRTCTFAIEFSPRPFDSFDTFWRTAATTEDPNPANNQADYRFIAGIPLIPPQPVPGLRLIAQLLLAASLLLLALQATSAVRRRGRNSS